MFKPDHNTIVNPETATGDFWYCEHHSTSSGLYLRIRRHLEHRRSKYQEIDIFETCDYGKVLTLDRMVMLTERDEAGYHEMLVHVPMLVHPDPRQVLVVGGGDGGTLRELLRYPGLERAVQVEIDGEVVEVCRTHFPWAATVYDDPRVELVVGDAVEYMKGARDEFDVVIMDSTDPVGPAEGLFREPFFRDLHAALRSDGVMSGQMGSAFYSADSIGELAAMLRRIFRSAAIYTTHVPSYPAGLWALALASRMVDVRQQPDKVRYRTIRGELRYYNLQIHIGSFNLPEYLRRRKETDG